MTTKLLQETIDFVNNTGCDGTVCRGPTLRPTPFTCPRCRLLARLLKAQKTYKPRAFRGNVHLNLTKEI
jgi:hypothetical protein